MKREQSNTLMAFYGLAILLGVAEMWHRCGWWIALGALLMTGCGAFLALSLPNAARDLLIRYLDT